MPRRKSCPMRYALGSVCLSEPGTACRVAKLTREMLKQLCLELFVNRKKPEALEVQFGINRNTIRRIRDAGAYVEERAACIKELRAEGYTVVL